MVVRAEMRLFDCGLALRAMPGQDRCGDAAVLVPGPGGVLLAAIDGLGHGADAASAAATATAAIRRSAGDDPTAVMRACHDALRGTRGAAVSLASLSARTGLLTWIGVGNVEGRVVPGIPQGAHAVDALPSHAGVPGHDLPGLRPTSRQLRRGDLVLIATDGVDAAFADDLDVTGSAQDVADRVLERHAATRDDALILALRYIGGGR